CDIALMVEDDNAHRPYDWERALRGSRSQVEQIGVAIRLAEALLGAAAGARVADAPVPPLPVALPGWVAPAVLTQWAVNPRRTIPGVRELLAGPGSAWTALASRWPDPLSATVRVGARLDDGARWPIQVAAFGKYAGKGTLRT